jgi:hypothetical protein
MSYTKALILFLFLFLFHSISIYANADITFKGLRWGQTLNELKHSKVFKDMNCSNVLRHESHILQNCFAVTSLLGREVTADIDLLDNKLVSISLSYEIKTNAQSLYLELKEAFQSKFGSFQSCTDDKNPDISSKLGYKSTLYDCYWIGEDERTMVRVTYMRIESLTNQGRKPRFSLDVHFGERATANTIFELRQNELIEEEIKRRRDL